jgi:transposase
MDRRSAAKIGGMDRQTPRDWVHRFNDLGPDGLIGSWTDGPKPRLSEEQPAEFARIVEVGPDREKDGVVRWRRIDLKRVIAERFGVDFHPRYVGKLLHKLGFSHMSARPRHPAQDERIVEAFKALARPVCKMVLPRSPAEQSASTYLASRDSLQPRWRYARSGPHKSPGVERRFLTRIPKRRSTVRSHRDWVCGQSSDRVRSLRRPR